MKDWNKLTRLGMFVGLAVLVVAAASTVTTHFDNVAVKYSTTLSNVTFTGVFSGTNIPTAVQAYGLGGTTNVPVDDTDTTTNTWGFWVFFTNNANHAVLKVRAFPDHTVGGE